MSQENVDIVRRRYEQFAATGGSLTWWTQGLRETTTPDFVWDMSKFRGWPEQQTYEGVEGARAFLRAWLEVWDDWELEVEAFHDAGDKVVAIVRQRARSKTSGLPVDMAFGQVWTIRDGKSARMEMYADPAEALNSVGLSEQDAHADP
jgi:ketosteroid isomerase-like protein